MFIAPYENNSTNENKNYNNNDDIAFINFFSIRLQKIYVKMQIQAEHFWYLHLKKIIM